MNNCISQESFKNDFFKLKNKKIELEDATI